MLSNTRAAIAHLWFELIHPFDDGNGRVGRAIAEHALGQSLRHPPLLSLSPAVELDRNAYYEKRSNACKSNMNVTEWIKYFTELTLKAQHQASAKIEYLVGKTRFWDANKTKTLNDR